MRGKQTVATFMKDADGLLLKHQKSNLNCWREYFCKLLNPVRAQHFESFEEEIGEEICLTETKVSTAIKSLKASKAAGEDDIRRKKLKAMNNFGVRCGLYCIAEVSTERYGSISDVTFFTEVANPNRIFSQFQQSYLIFP